MRTVAALYIDPRGPYPKMPDVDCWDEVRDARLYDGPHPVVAHPPCNAWGPLRHLSFGAGKDCGPRAVQQVIAHGGVLEQPAGSKLWEHCRIPPPRAYTEDEIRSGQHGWFSVEVEQVAWGHVARKRTWLFCVRVPGALVLDTLRTGGTPTHWIGGGRTSSSRKGAPIPEGIKATSAQQRRRTPPAFAEWLVMLARSVS